MADYINTLLFGKPGYGFKISFGKRHTVTVKIVVYIIKRFAQKGDDILESKTNKNSKAKKDYKPIYK